MIHKWALRIIFAIFLMIVSWYIFLVFVVFRLDTIKPEEVEGFKKVASLFWQWATSTLF